MFDRYVMVDWSANSRPKAGRDSIWICVLDAGGGALTLNPTTRAAAEAHLREILIAATEKAERTLVGFDFPFGYPAGLAAALRLGEPAWRSVWAYLADRLSEGPDNGNNRFEVASEINRRLTEHAFWGCPVPQGFEHLSSRRDEARYRIDPGGAGLAEWRRAEELLRKRGRWPHSAWKLLGAGSVGSQAITGIPVVARLRDERRLRAVSCIWPFEVVVPDLPCGLPAVIHAEVWPSLVDAPPEDGRVKDEVQVVRLAERLAQLDGSELLEDLFAAGASDLAAEEGWILGVASLDRDPVALMSPAPAIGERSLRGAT